MGPVIYYNRLWGVGGGGGGERIGYLFIKASSYQQLYLIMRGRVKKKYCCVRGVTSYYIKNKNMGRCVFSTQPDQQKRHQCKYAQKIIKH